MKKQMKLVLLVAMIAVMLVMTAMFASAAEFPVGTADELTAALGQVESADDVISLTANIDVAEPVVIGAPVTINGNGFTITGSGSATVEIKTIGVVNLYNVKISGNGLRVADAATVTLDQGTIVSRSAGSAIYTAGTGAVVNIKSATVQNTSGDMITSGANYTLNVYEGANLNAGGDGIYTGTTMTLNIYGGTITAKGSTINPNAANTVVNITGGKITTTGNYVMRVRGAGAVFNVGGTVEMIGTIDADGAGSKADWTKVATLNITGGTFSGGTKDHNVARDVLLYANNNGMIINISGGNFSSNSQDTNVVSNVTYYSAIVFTNDQDVQLHITGGTFTVNGYGMTVNAASANQLTLGGTHIAGDNKTYIVRTCSLGADSFRIENMEIDGQDKSGVGLRIETAKSCELRNVTISGTGSYAFNPSNATRTATIDLYDCNFTVNASYAINASGATLNFHSGTYTATGSAGVIRMSDGDVTSHVVIEGGSFIANTGYIITYNTVAKTYFGSLTIKGGTFTGGNAWVLMGSAIPVTIEGGTFSGLVAPATTSGSRGIWLQNASYDNRAWGSEAIGKLNISGGKFTVEANSGATVFINCAGADVNVSGGTFVCEKDIPIFAIQDGDCVSKVTISDGSFTSKGHVVNFTAGQTAGRPAGDLIITGGTMNVGDGRYGINVTHKGASGVVTIENVTIAPADPTTSCIPVVVGNENVTLNIKSGSFDSNHSNAAIWINAAAAVNITGGTFEGYRTMNIVDCANVTISGGTFSHNVQDDSGKDQTTSKGVHLRGESTQVTITGGEFVGKAAGVTVEAGTAIIAGGKFTMSGEDACGVVLAGGFAAVSNGTFTVNEGGYALSTAGAGTMNVFGGTFNGDGGKLWMGGTAIVNLSAPVTFEASTTVNNNIHLGNASEGGKLNIDGGTYYGGLVSVINAAGAEVAITGGTFESEANIIAIGDNDVTSPVSVMGGEFKIAGTGSIFFINQVSGERAESGKILGSTTITAGTFDAGEGMFLSASFGKLISFALTVGDIEVTGAGKALISISAASEKAAITFNGGTYTLTSEDGTLLILKQSKYIYSESENSFKDEDGNVTDQEGLDAWLALYNKYGATFDCAGTITFNGTTLLDKTAAGEAMIDITGAAVAPIFNDCAILCQNLKAYFMATGDAKTAAPMSNAVPTVVYGEETYYTWHKLAATDATYSPILENGASVRVTVGSQGIRFTTKLSALTVAKLEALGTVTYGTLIAPADVVLKAGAFTIEALTAYATENFEGDTSNTSKVFVNIKAVNSLQNDPVEGVTFNGVLTNVKESNYNRGMAAVGYACVNGTYYYSAYDCTVNARTMSDIAAAAIADVVEEPTGDYIHLIDGKYSRYNQEQIDALKVYLPAV